VRHEESPTGGSKPNRVIDPLILYFFHQLGQLHFHLSKYI
jgi:hypothetical protein